MKTIHYVFASMKHKKRLTISLLLLCLFFLFLLTNFSLSIDIEKNILLQLSQLPNHTKFINYHQQLLDSYRYFYLSTLVVIILCSLIFSYFFITSVKKDIIRLRLIGFSNYSIIKQMILSLFIPMICAFLLFLLFVTIFQQTYESTVYYFPFVEKRTILPFNSLLMIKKMSTGIVVKTTNHLNQKFDHLRLLTIYFISLKNFFYLFLIFMLTICNYFFFIHYLKKNWGVQQL